eukprot:Gb_38084 [translate_table: standard]
MIEADNLLFAWGFSYLPASTTSLLISSQLAFNSIFSVVIVCHKFTAYSINSVVLLVLSSVLLACKSGGDRPKGVTQTQYIKGFLLAVASVALNSAGWPFIVLMLLLLYIPKSSTIKPNPITLKMLMCYYALGVMIEADNLLFAWGFSYLPASTTSLLISSQLAFNSIFSVVIVCHKFTAYSINSVVLLVLSSVLLACKSGGDRPKGVTQTQYIKGFLLAVASVALNRRDGKSLEWKITGFMFESQGPWTKQVIVGRIDAANERSLCCSIMYVVYSKLVGVHEELLTQGNDNKSTEDDEFLSMDQEEERRKTFADIFKVQQDHGGIIEPKKLPVILPGMFLHNTVARPVEASTSSHEGISSGEEVSLGQGSVETAAAESSDIPSSSTGSLSAVGTMPTRGQTEIERLDGGRRELHIVNSIIHDCSRALLSLENFLSSLRTNWWKEIHFCLPWTEFCKFALYDVLQQLMRQCVPRDVFRESEILAYFAVNIYHLLDVADSEMEFPLILLPDMKSCFIESVLSSCAYLNLVCMVELLLANSLLSTHFSHYDKAPLIAQNLLPAPDLSTGPLSAPVCQSYALSCQHPSSWLLVQGSLVAFTVDVICACSFQLVLPMNGDFNNIVAIAVNSWVAIAMDSLVNQVMASEDHWHHYQHLLGRLVFMGPQRPWSALQPSPPTQLSFWYYGRQAPLVCSQPHVILRTRLTPDASGMTGEEIGWTVSMVNIVDAWASWGGLRGCIGGGIDVAADVATIKMEAIA